jgi:transposase
MDMLNLTLITLAWELYGQGVPKIRIAQHLGKHRETIILWIQGIERLGLAGFLNQYEKAKKDSREKTG